MKRNRRTINLRGGAGLAVPVGPPKAPERLCLWKPGPVVGDFGENVWDSAAAKLVMGAYQERGNPIPVDIEHNSNPRANPNLDPSNPPKGGGYVWLKLAPDGALWLDPIQWSDYAREEIESGSRRSVSPDWDFDPSTGRPVRLNKVSLVQNPGTYAIGLMASAKRATANGAQTMDMAMLMAALKAARTAEDVGAALDALLTELDKTMGEPAPASEPEMGADLPPEEQQMGGGMTPEEKMAKAFAAAFKVSQKAPQAKGVSPELVRREAVAAARLVVREEHQKTQLLASAKASPAWTDALGDELQALPVSAVKRIVAALPRPSMTASATAAADPQGVKPQPLPGPAPEQKLTPSEEMARNLIANAGKGRDEIIKQAKAPADPSSGEFVFSAFSQMTPRKTSN